MAKLFLIQMIKSYHLCYIQSVVNRKSQNDFFFTFFHQLFTERDADSCIYCNPMALPPVQKQHSQNHASLDGLLLPMLANTGALCPATEWAARGEVFPTQFSPKKSHLPIQCLIAQYYVYRSSSKELSLIPEPPWPHCLFSILQNVAPCWGEESPGHACRWHTCKWDWVVPGVALGLPLITWGTYTGIRCSS